MTLYEERLQGLADGVVTAAVWDPLLHPRARNGQFIKVGGFVRGLFRIGNGSEQKLNGQVLEVRANKRDPKDPLIKVKTKHGELTTPASRIDAASKPKGFLSKLPWAPPDPEDEAYRNRPLDGDVMFTTGRSMEGRDLNGVPLGEMVFDPHDVADVDVGEPPMPDTKKSQSAGVLITEEDGRVWLYEPANHFGGYSTTISKGRVEKGDTVQQAALREAYEELGLVAEITGYLGDYEGSVTNTRLYKGKRIGGAPWEHDFESAEVRLVTPETAATLFNTERDQMILADLTGNQEPLEKWREAHPPPPPTGYDWLKELEDKYGKGTIDWKGHKPPPKSPYTKGKPLFDPGPTQIAKQKAKDEALALTMKYGTKPSPIPPTPEPDDAGWMADLEQTAQVMSGEGTPLELDVVNWYDEGEFGGDISATLGNGKEVGFISYSGDEEGVFLDEWEVDPSQDETDVLDAMTDWLKELGVPVIEQTDIVESSQTELLERTVTAGVASRVVSQVWDELLHPRGKDGRFIDKGGFVRGMFTLPDGTRENMRAEVIAYAPNVGNPDDPIIQVKTADGGKAVALASQVSAVPMTKAELNVSAAQFQLDYFEAKQHLADVLQQQGPKAGERRAIGDLTKVELADGKLPSDYMYEIEAASTAVGAVLDKEITRRTNVIEGERLLTPEEFVAASTKALDDLDAIKTQAHALAVAEGHSPADMGGWLSLAAKHPDDHPHYTPEMHALISQFSAKRDELAAIDANRHIYQTAYAKQAQEVLAEVTPGGLGGDFDVKSYKLTPEQEEAMHEIVALTAGSVYPSWWVDASNQHKIPVSVALDTQRSYYNHAAGHVVLPPKFDNYAQQTFVHEFGHRMEHVVPGLKPLEFAFYWRRMGKQYVPQISMNEAQAQLGKKGGFGPTEVTRPDEFSNVYMGKDYGVGPDSFYEIFTMGAEQLLTPEIQRGHGSPKLIANDADYRAFILGAVVNVEKPNTWKEPLPSGDPDVELQADVQDVQFKALLINGVVANIKRIERDEDGNMFLITTIDERVPSARVVKINPGGDLTKEKDAVKLLPWKSKIEAAVPAVDTREFGEYTLQYEAVDEGERKPRHVITAYRGNEKVGELNWYGTTGTIHNVDVDEAHARQGLATAMWEWGQEMPKKPKHSADRTAMGDAWAKAVGGKLPRRPRDVVSTQTRLLERMTPAPAWIDKQGEIGYTEDDDDWSDVLGDD